MLLKTSISLPSQWIKCTLNQLSNLTVSWNFFRKSEFRVNNRSTRCRSSPPHHHHQPCPSLWSQKSGQHDFQPVSLKQMYIEKISQKQTHRKKQPTIFHFLKKKHAEKNNLRQKQPDTQKDRNGCNNALQLSLGYLLDISFLNWYLSVQYSQTISIVTWRKEEGVGFLLLCIHSNY